MFIKAVYFVRNDKYMRRCMNVCGSDLLVLLWAYMYIINQWAVIGPRNKWTWTHMTDLKWISSNVNINSESIGDIVF